MVNSMAELDDILGIGTQARKPDNDELGDILGAPPAATVQSTPSPIQQSNIPYDQWLKKYNVKNPNDPRHEYNYKAVYDAGLTPDLYKNASLEDKAEDIRQGRFLPGGDLYGIDPNTHYMWPDEGKTKNHPIPPKPIKPGAFEKAKEQAKAFLPQLAPPATMGMPAARTLSPLYSDAWQGRYTPMQTPSGGIQPIPQPDPRSQAIGTISALQEATQGIPFINEAFQNLALPGMTEAEQATQGARHVAMTTPGHMMMAPARGMYEVGKTFTEVPTSAMFGAKDFDELFAKTQLGKIKIPIPGKALGLDKDIDIPLSSIPAFGARMLASAAFWGAFSKAIGQDPVRYVTGDKEAAKVSDLKNAIDNQDWQRVGEFLKNDSGFVQKTLLHAAKAGEKPTVLSDILRQIKVDDPDLYKSLYTDILGQRSAGEVPPDVREGLQQGRLLPSPSYPLGHLASRPPIITPPPPSYPLGFPLPPDQMPPMDAEILSERGRPQLNPPPRDNQLGFSGGIPPKDYPLGLPGGAFSGGPSGGSGGMPFQRPPSLSKTKTLPPPTPKSIDELFKEAQDKFYKEQAGEYWTGEPEDTITETKSGSGKPGFDIDKMNDPEYFENFFKTPGQRIEEQKRINLAKEQQTETQATKQQKIIEENARIEKELGLKHGDVVTRTVEGIGATGDVGKIVYDKNGLLSVKTSTERGMPNKTMLLPVTYEWGKKHFTESMEHPEQIKPITEQRKFQQERQKMLKSIPKIISDETGAISLPALKQTTQKIHNYLKPEYRNEIIYKVDNLINEDRALRYGMEARYKNNLKAVPDETEQKLQGLEMLQGGKPVTPLQQQARQIFDAWGMRAEASGRISGRIQDYVPFMTTADYKTWKEVNRILGNNSQALQRLNSVDPRFSTWLRGRQIHRESADFADYQSRLDNINQELANFGSNIRLRPETNLVKLIYNYEHQVEQQVTMQEFMNDMENYRHPVSLKPMFVKATQPMSDPDFVKLPGGINIKTGFYRQWNPKLNVYDQIEYKYYVHKDLAKAFRNFLTPDVSEDWQKGYGRWVTAMNVIKRIKLLNPLTLIEKMGIRSLADEVRLSTRGGPLLDLFKGNPWKTGTLVLKGDMAGIHKIFPALVASGLIDRNWTKDDLIEDFIRHGGQWHEEFKEGTKAPQQMGNTVFHESLSKLGLSKEWIDKAIESMLKVSRIQSYLYGLEKYYKPGKSFTESDIKMPAAYDANEMTYAALRHRQSPEQRWFSNVFLFSKNAMDNQLGRFKRLAFRPAEKGLYTSDQVKAMSEEEWKKAFAMAFITVGLLSFRNKQVTGQWFNTEKDTIGKIGYWKDKKTGEISYRGTPDWLSDFIYIATGQPGKFLGKMGIAPRVAIELGTGRKIWSGEDISEYPVTSIKGMEERGKHVLGSVLPDEGSLIGGKIKRLPGMSKAREISKEAELRKMERGKKFDRLLDDEDIVGAARFLSEEGKTQKEITRILTNESKSKLIRIFSRMSLEDKEKFIKEINSDKNLQKNIPIEVQMELAGQLERAYKAKRRVK